MGSPIGAWGGAQKGIWRYTMYVFFYEWLLLVIGEIISRKSIYLLLVNWADQIQ